MKTYHYVKECRFSTLAPRVAAPMKEFSGRPHHAYKNPQTRAAAAAADLPLLLLLLQVSLRARDCCITRLVASTDVPPSRVDFFSAAHEFPPPASSTTTTLLSSACISYATFTGHFLGSP